MEEGSETRGIAVDKAARGARAQSCNAASRQCSARCRARRIDRAGRPSDRLEISPTRQQRDRTVERLDLLLCMRQQLRAWTLWPTDPDRLDVCARVSDRARLRCNEPGPSMSPAPSQPLPTSAGRLSSCTAPAPYPLRRGREIDELALFEPEEPLRHVSGIERKQAARHVVRTVHLSACRPGHRARTQLRS